MPLFYGIWGLSSHSLPYCLFFVGAYVTNFWDPMGHARFSGEFGVLLEELVGEIFFRHMEYGSWLFDVSCLVGKKPTLF